MKTLTQLIDIAESHARHVMIEANRDMIPTWFMIDRSDNLILAGTPWKDLKEKEFILGHIRNFMRKHNIKMYCLIVEAWAATALPEDPYQPSSKSPDRREVVMATATDGHSTEWKQWNTKRGDDGKVISLEPEIDLPTDKIISHLSELLNDYSNN